MNEYNPRVQFTTTETGKEDDMKLESLQDLFLAARRAEQFKNSEYGGVWPHEQRPGFEEAANKNWADRKHTVINVKTVETGTGL